jgi:hypothetical protein
MLPDVTIPTYDQAYGSLGAVYDPQVKSVQSQIDQLPGQEQATLSSLDQAKANAFRDIANSANSKGMLFSGFTPDQEATYTGEKYLPAYAAAKAATVNARTSLTDKINQIQSARAKDALGIVSSAQSTASTNAYKNAQLQLSAARLANSQAKTAAKLPSQQEVSSAIRSGLATVRGKDGYVAPQDYARAYQDWTQAGFDGSQFDKYFGDLMNPKNHYYQYAKTQVG